MATVTMRYEFLGGGAIQAAIEMPTGYPDALHEAVSRCADAFLTALVAYNEVENDDDDDNN